MKTACVIPGQLAPAILRESSLVPAPHPALSCVGGESLDSPSDGWFGSAGQFSFLWRKPWSQTPGQQKRGIKIQIGRQGSRCPKRGRMLSKKAWGKAARPAQPQVTRSLRHHTAARFGGSEGTRQHLRESRLQAGRGRKANKEASLPPEQRKSLWQGQPCRQDTPLPAGQPKLVRLEAATSRPGAAPASRVHACCQRHGGLCRTGPRRDLGEPMAGAEADGAHGAEGQSSALPRLQLWAWQLLAVPGHRPACWLRLGPVLAFICLWVITGKVLTTAWPDIRIRHCRV